MIKTGADNVGGPTRVEGKTFTQKTVAAAYSSPFALGGSKHYDENFEGEVDTVSWGIFKKQFFHIKKQFCAILKQFCSKCNFRLSAILPYIVVRTWWWV